MSDSESSDAPSLSIPPDHKIETALRVEVKKAAKGPAEDFTRSRIRKAAEKSLKLPEGFFRGNEKWGPRSKEIVEEQVAIENGEDEAESQSTPAKPSASIAASKSSTKRNSPDSKPQPRKRQKLDSDDNETSALSSPPSESEGTFEEETKPKPKPKKAAKVKKPAVSQSRSKPETKAETKDKDVSDDAAEEINASGSELSDVLDEAPVKSRGKSKSADAVEQKAKASKTKPKPSTEPDPDQEEIKKLQGWLVKCGIRKVWGKELKPFETPKSKIKHLRGMLTEAGMTGRYSNEKAGQIKEARELAADIEAVQEGNERWGKGDEDDDEGEGDGDKSRAGRRLVRGAKNYDFLSSDGEETD